MNVPFIIQVFKARFKAAATPSFWAAFFLLAFGILALGFIFNGEDGLRIRVGVLRPQTEQTEAFLERFIYYAGENSQIVTYEDEEQMKLDVSAHKLECAYVLGGEHAVAYRSPQTEADKIFDLTLAAVYTEKLAGELGAEALEIFTGEVNVLEDDSHADETNASMDGSDESDPVGNAATAPTLAKEIQNRTDEYLKDGALMKMEYVELNSPAGSSSQTEPAPYRRLFHGLLGLAALLPALLCAMSMAGDANKSAAARLGASGIFTLAAFLVIFALVALFMTVTLSAGNLLFPGLVLDWPGELAAALSLSCAAAGMAVLLAAFVPADAFPAVVSFIFIFAALFGGAVFDMREVIESAAWLGYLFPNFYYVSGM